MVIMRVGNEKRKGFPKYYYSQRFVEKWMKKHIIIHGQIQAVGYRALVRVIAMNLQVKGSVRNLDNGTVEIFCEGTKGTLERFLRAIDIKGTTDDHLVLNVDSIEEIVPPEKGLPRERFGFPFFVEYDGMELSPFEKETMERSEMAILVLGNMNSNLGNKMDNLGEKTDNVGNKVDVLGEKVDVLGENINGVGDDVKDLGDKVDNLGGKMDNLGDKMDCIGTKMDNIDKNTGSMNKDLNQRFDRIDDKYDKFGKSMIRLEGDIHEIKEALVTLVDHVIETNND